MNAPRPIRELSGDAPVPVHKPKRTSLRRHWLTGALVLALAAVVGRTGVQLYQTQVRLQRAQATRSDLDAQLVEAKRQKQDLESELARVSSDAYREVQAKQLGYIRPDETVYQKGK